MQEVNNVIRLANDLYKQIASKPKYYIPGLADCVMELVTDKELNTEELRSLLSYYSSWMAYFQVEYHRWKFVSEWLDSYHKEQTAKMMIQEYDGPKYEKEHYVKTQTAYIRTAKTIADGKLMSAKGDLETATSQRDIISRQITLKGLDMKTRE